MTEKRSRAALALKKIRERSGLSVREVADKLGKPSSTYATYEDRYKKEYLPMDLAKQLATIFDDYGIDPAELYALAGLSIIQTDDVTQVNGTVKTRRPRVSNESPSPLGELARRAMLIEELDVRAGAGGILAMVDDDVNGEILGRVEPVTRWSVPGDLFAPMTRSPSEALKIIMIVGPSMEPELPAGTRVVVDTADITPSPPGIFCLWDGLGFVVKYVEHIPHSEPPTVRISSANPRFQPYERVLGEAHIQGRVFGHWNWT